AISPNLGKVQALDPNFPVSRIYDQGRELQEAVSSLWKRGIPTDEMVARFERGGALSLSLPGLLSAGNRSLAAVLDELDRELVRAPAARRERAHRVSRLHSELRAVFVRAKILGSKPSDIARHLVVPNFP